MDPRSIDLNLLRVFDTIRRTRSVTAAADELGVTQPSLSNALSRLRALFGDPLFVRTATGMQPTPVAERVAAPVRDALALIDSAMSTPESFDPRRADLAFRISTSDLGETVLLPPLIEALRADAPRVRMENRPVPRKELASALESGEIHVALGALGKPGRGVRERLLFSERYACVMRVGHPLVRGRVTAGMLKDLEYALVAPAETVHRQAEVALRRRGLLDRIMLRTPHFMAVPVILERSDLVCIVPSLLARHFCRDRRLQMAALPLQLAPVRVSLLWHQRFDRDPANLWLRTHAVRLDALGSVRPGAAGTSAGD